jgi:general stress protein 26
MNTATTSLMPDVLKLAELIRDVRVAMLATFPSGAKHPHARPMYTQGVDPNTFDGTIWFMTSQDAEMVREIEQNPSVLLTYAEYGKNRFISVVGQAHVEHNPAKAAELWNPHAKGWFPAGPDDPNLRLIRVQTESAEYWDGPSKSSYMFSLLKAVVTGERVETTGEHGVLRP